MAELSCNACGRSNYVRSVDSIMPSGLELFELGVNSNGYQVSVIRFCPDCIKELRSKLFDFSA